VEVKGLLISEEKEFKNSNKNLAPLEFNYNLKIVISVVVFALPEFGARRIRQGACTVQLPLSTVFKSRAPLLLLSFLMLSNSFLISPPLAPSISYCIADPYLRRPSPNNPFTALAAAKNHDPS